MFKHSENTIDPRDTNLVSYNKQTKKFVVESSSLNASGIEPLSHYFTIGGPKWVIYLWSEKYQLHITYVQNRKVKSPDGEVIADVFVPYFGIITGGNDSKAHTASLGTELHILND